MVTVSVRDNESTQRMWLPTCMVSPRGPITFVAVAYVWGQATRPVFLGAGWALDCAAWRAGTWTATGEGSVQLMAATLAPASSTGRMRRRRTDIRFPHSMVTAVAKQEPFR